MPIQYSHYLLAMGKRYLDRLEVVRKEKNVSYFTAKEAMKYLEEEINNPVIDETSKKDLEENEVEDMDVGLEFDEDSMNQAIIEFNKSKYLYEETENPDEFFLPYIWTNIILTTPELIWRLPNIHHFSSLYSS